MKVHLTETVYNMKLKIDIDPELIKDENGNKLEIKEMDIEMENQIVKDETEEKIDSYIQW